MFVSGLHYVVRKSMLGRCKSFSTYYWSHVCGIGSVCGVYLEMLMCCVDILLFKEEFVVFGVTILEAFEEVFFWFP